MSFKRKGEGGAVGKYVRVRKGSLLLLVLPMHEDRYPYGMHFTLSCL